MQKGFSDFISMQKRWKEDKKKKFTDLLKKQRKRKP